MSLDILTVLKIMLTGFPKGLEFSGYYEHCLSFVGERVEARRSGLGPQRGWWDGLGGGGGLVRKPLLSRGERWVNRRLSYASSFCQLGLNVKGLRVFRVIFSLKREDMLKPILGSSPQIGHLILL